VNIRRFALAALAAGLAHASPGLAAGAEPASRIALDQAAALRDSQAVLGSQPGDYTLLDREGRPVRLASYRGKPLLVSFIYTGCFTVCPTSTRMLNEAVTTLQERFGASQFNVVSIGFNQPADSPQALKAFAAQNRITLPNWEFLSPHPAIVAPLTRDFGFSYAATAAGFDHLLQLSILDGEGRIVRQVYGDRLGAAQLGEPLKQLLAGAPLAQDAGLSGLIDRVRILCSVYDPATGTYRVDYGLAIMVAGGITFALSMAWFFLAEWRTQRRLRRGKAAHASVRLPA
jgi:protein SCO1/2